MSRKPSYLLLHESGDLQRRIGEIEEIYRDCTLCPHRCRIDRTSGEKGFCRSGILPTVASFAPHFGEEPPLVGCYGSGTIFFSQCTLKCVFCQNYDISQLDRGQEISCHDLAYMMISLQEQGCHNINFVTPTHMIHPILKSLSIAIPMGLKVPLVYNSVGYDSISTLQLLDGIFDIYMPDFKYADSEIGFDLSGIENYPSVAAGAVREMHRQTGDLKLNSQGIAEQGLIVRHLVLPGNLAGTDKIINFIAELSTNTYFNLMDQYRPEFHAREFPGLRKRVPLMEFQEFRQMAIKRGLRRLAR